MAPKSQNVANVSGGGALATLTHDTLSFSFTIVPTADRSVYLGAGNTVKFPAGSVCAPSSSYGASEWDNACTPATDTIVVNAKGWLDGSDQPHVDFATHLRFVPSSNPLQWVTISFTDTSSTLNPEILYCATTYSQCVSELSGDATLATVKNTVTNKVTRRIKHFSGYMLGSGEACNASPENPDCVEGGDGNKVSANIIKLSNNSTASANIGPMGGVLKLESEGLTVVVPAGAVSQMTKMSVSARAGSLLSYEFQPHGIQFAVPLTVTQDLAGTDWASRSAGSMQVVYFANESQINDAQGVVIPSEVLDVTVNGRGQASFNIKHFSGYMFASGDDNNDTSDANRVGGGARASFGRTYSAVKRATTSTVTKR